MVDANRDHDDPGCIAMRHRRPHRAVPPALRVHAHISGGLFEERRTNMSLQQWRDWVSPDIDYIKVCPDLPVAPD